jgi:uncharacterized membrane protein
MINNVRTATGRGKRAARPFRGALWRGLAIVSPPLLTVLIIVWAVNTTKIYFLEPVTGWAREGLVWWTAAIRETAPAEGFYHQISNGTYIPESVYETVKKHSDGPLPSTGDGFYRRYVDLTYLRPQYAIPLFLSVFILLLYFLGKFMAAGIGGFFVNLFDRLVRRVPGVRAVYSAVKQVSDFVFTEREIAVTRIVAVEYPRLGAWSLGFVTGESLLAISDVLHEPVYAVLIPYSPVPVTGCIVTVRKSECIDLNITFDQACQFIVSCGVVVPPPELQRMQVVANP